MENSLLLSLSDPHWHLHKKNFRTFFACAPSLTDLVLVVTYSFGQIFSDVQAF